MGTNDGIFFSESSGDARKYNICKELNRVLIICLLHGYQVSNIVLDVNHHNTDGPRRALTYTDSPGALLIIFLFSR